MINGFGRTGKMFGFQHYGVSPDIIAIAKGISSAYLPIAATVVKNSVFNSFYGDPADNRQVGQVNTYGGHPVAAAVAMRNIEIMEAEQLTERSASMGAYLLGGLRTLMRHQIVGDVRGKGLLLGRWNSSRIVHHEGACWSHPNHQHRRFLSREWPYRRPLRRGGVVTAIPLPFCPPLVITRAECDRIVDILDRALGTLDLG